MRCFKRAFVLFVTNYSVFCGLSSVGYDIQRGRIIRHKAIKYFTLLQNVMMLLSLPFSFQNNLQHLDIFDTNPVTKYANLANVSLRNLVVLLIALLRRRSESQFLEILEELMQLEQECCDRLGTDSNRRQPWFFRSLGVKFVVMMVQRAFIQNVLEKVSAESMQMLISGYYDFNMANLMQALSFYFLGVLTWMTRLFHLQNERLLQIKEELGRNRRSPSLAVDLDEVCAIHDRLTRLLRWFCDIYKYHVLLLLATVFASTATSGYYLVLAVTENEENLGIKHRLMAFGSNALSFLDIYFFYNICGRTEYVSAKTFEILRQFTDLPATRSPRLAQSCEMLSLLGMSDKARVRIHGMFNLNRRSTLLLIGETIVYTIVLIQSDYKNIRGLNL